MEITGLAYRFDLNNDELLKIIVDTEKIPHMTAVNLRV